MNSRGQLLLWLVMIASVVAPVRADELPTSPELATLIRNLDSREFEVRERASAELLRYGADAVTLLANAARKGSPEAAARSLDLLNRLYASNQDDSFDATEAALFDLMTASRTATRDRAARILDLGGVHRLDRAISALEKMGAMVTFSDRYGAPIENADLKNRDLSTLHCAVMITRRWSGGDAGLKQLLRLYHVPRLSIYRTKLATVSAEVLDATVAEMENVDQIQVRGEGYLGIKASQPAQFCIVSSVIKDSAADKAGLREGDHILTFDGREIASFADLIELLLDKVPGDKVPLVFARNGEQMTVEVELTDWK